MIVLICVGSSCHLKGSEEIVELLKKKVEEHKLDNEVTLAGSFCMRSFDVKKKEHRERLIDTFINAIFLFDNKLVITFNYQNGSKTILLSDLEKSSCLNEFGRPKIGSRKIPDFSLFISQNLLKSRVFSTNIMGLFFPAFGVEQAHFSHLTTCLTT